MKILCVADRQSVLRPLLLLALLITTLPGTIHAAVPDAGQTVREAERQARPPEPEPLGPILQQQEATPAPAGGNDVTVPVSMVRVSGSTVFPSAELEALVAYLNGGERTLAELNTGADLISAYYRDQGFLLARAYLPAQEISEGVVLMEVAEGRLGTVQLANTSLLDDQAASVYLSALDGTAVLQQQPLERTLYLLNETPGVGAANATFQPGASVGTSDLLVSLAPAVPYVLRLETDNFGNRYTGEYRLGAALDLNSPLDAGDLFSLRALATEHLHYVRAAYQVAAGGNGLRFGAAWSDTGYELAKEFAALQADGTATSASLFLLYPFVRRLDRSVTGAVTLEEKKLEDTTAVPVTASARQVLLANVSVSGSWRDLSGAGSITSADVALVSGRLTMDAAALAQDAVTARSAGTFNRVTWALRHQQLLGANDALALSASGQFADKNLNSSEKFLLGGAYGIRAFPSGEGNADTGWLLNLEWRHRFLPALEGTVFYDYGSVDFNRKRFVAGSNTRQIAGAGVGLNTSFAGLQLNAWLAWRTEGGVAVSEPAALDEGRRLWVQVSRQF